MSDSPVVQEWIDQGALKSTRLNLTLVLQMKFRTANPPADLAETIQRTTTLVTLENWLGIALVASTLDDLRTAISASGTNGS